MSACRSVACFALTCCCDGASLSRRPQFFFLISPRLVDRNKIPVPVFLKLTQLLDELVDPAVACQRACDFLDHRDCDRFLMFPVESLRVVWVVVLCVEWSVVGPRYWPWLCCEADRCTPCNALRFPPPPPWLCRVGNVWASSALCWLSCLGRVVVVLVGTSPYLYLWLINRGVVMLNGTSPCAVLHAPLPPPLLGVRLLVIWRVHV